MNQFVFFWELNSQSELTLSTSNFLPVDDDETNEENR